MEIAATVGKLIEILKQYPGDWNVCTRYGTESLPECSDFLEVLEGNITTDKSGSVLFIERGQTLVSDYGVSRGAKWEPAIYLGRC